MRRFQSLEHPTPMNNELQRTRYDVTQQDMQSHHFGDRDGNPEGGCAFGTGFCITWQRGPLGRGDESRGANGAFVETIIQACIDRLEFYQECSGGRFKCQENDDALDHLQRALERLEDRTTRREHEGKEGTNTP